MSADEVIKRCDENTIGVVPTLGTTFTLQYEPVQAAAMALDDLEEEHGLDIPMHIDAASGASSRRLSIRRWCGIFAFRASNRSTHPGTNLVSRRSAADGSSGARHRIFRKNLSST